MYNIYVLFVFLFPFVLSDFKTEQLKYPRVKTAYQEKEKVVLDLLHENDISSDRLQIFIRAFKQEQVLEVWGKNSHQEAFALIKSYPFCASSGTLGPKRKQGDSQIPEGFYHLDRFNPQSAYYLSLGVNYPNSSDRILGEKGQLGGDIFIHGDCVTIGCIPLTDDKIMEVYVMAVEARNNGQAKIPVHIFPAKLATKKMENLKKRYSQNQQLVAFWHNLQKGYSFFEETKKLPKISVLDDGSYRIRNNP